ARLDQADAVADPDAAVGARLLADADAAQPAGVVAVDLAVRTARVRVATEPVRLAAPAACGVALLVRVAVERAAAERAAAREARDEHSGHQRQPFRHVS